VTKLKAQNRGISDLRGMRVLENLKTLDLLGNNVESIKELGGLGRLRELKISNNKVTSLEPITKLSELQTLFVDTNNLSGSVDVDSMRGLTILSLAANSITSVTGLEHLKKLQVLDLSENRITKIDGLQGLSQLLSLWLTGNRISDARFVAGLSEGLRSVGLSRNRIADVSMIPNGMWGVVVMKKQAVTLPEEKNQGEKTITLPRVDGGFAEPLESLDGFRSSPAGYSFNEHTGDVTWEADSETQGYQVAFGYFPDPKNKGEFLYSGWIQQSVVDK
jgi:Leucine-rich repeat (LRR) protein